VRTFMDEYRVDSAPGNGTEVTLIKRLNSNHTTQPRRAGP
jgi:hypothetical protein